ncbi:MAG: thiamine pyrophosphate-dependent enzyme [Geminicoccaceae bacterium]
MRRYELLQEIAPIFDREFVICNLGFPSQELYSIRDTERTFYMLGSMGLSSSIGLGLATQVNETVVSIDGDGSVLMNLGTLSTIAREAPQNFVLLIVDNGSYGSTGDQPTQTAKGTSLAAIAAAAGIESSIEVAGAEAADALRQRLGQPGPHVIVAKVEPGSPKLTPIPLSSLVIRDRFRDAIKAAQEGRAA